MLPISEIAELFGISDRTAFRLRADGELPEPTTKRGRELLWSPESLAEFVVGQCREKLSRLQSIVDRHGLGDSRIANEQRLTELARGWRESVARGEKAAGQILGDRVVNTEPTLKQRAAALIAAYQSATESGDTSAAARLEADRLELLAETERQITATERRIAALTAAIAAVKTIPTEKGSGDV